MKIIEKIVESQEAPKNKFVFWLDTTTNTLKRNINDEWVSIITAISNVDTKSSLYACNKDLNLYTKKVFYTDIKLFGNNVVKEGDLLLGTNGNLCQVVSVESIYCCVRFIHNVVAPKGEKGDKGEKGENGMNGYTFFPFISDNILSWTNDGNLPNPPDFNLGSMPIADIEDGKILVWDKENNQIVGSEYTINTLYDLIFKSCKFKLEEAGTGNAITSITYVENTNTYIFNKDGNFITIYDLENKVDKEEGKGLSTNDYTDEDKKNLNVLIDAYNNNTLGGGGGIDELEYIGDGNVVTDITKTNNSKGLVIFKEQNIDKIDETYINKLF